MAQTITNFLEKIISSSSSPTFQLSSRVFNFEISEKSQSIYLSLVDDLTAAINAKNAAEVQSILKKLDGWSQLIYVTNGDQITKNSYDITNNTYDPKSPASSDVIVTTTMNRFMAENLDKTIRTIRSAGWDPIVDPIDQNATNALAAILDKPEIYPVLNYINQGKAAAINANLDSNSTSKSKSLQQVLMVDYVSRGNDLLYSQMRDLQTAIDLNQSTLSYLNSLQDLMNQKDPQKFIMQLQEISAVNPSDLKIDTYSKFETDTFNQQLSNVPKFTAGQIREYVNTVQSLNLSSDTIAALTDAEYSQLTGTVGGSFVNLSTLQDAEKSFNATNNGINTIISNLDFIINQLAVGSGGSASSLSQALTTIKSDFQTFLDQGAATAVLNWVKDIGTGREGDCQRHLNDAIVASQSLNDSKREGLRRVMFVFEEFYKSATTILNRITQLIERLATSINK